jgi:EAL domain-containing protein (putative c-di-GMP-specific phosphodiesterase class I)
MMESADALAADLPRALEHRELVLHYQPKLHLATDRVREVEALLRWQHPKHGLLLPGAFLTGRIDGDVALVLGRWVVRAALDQCAAWVAEGADLDVCVNFSPRQFDDPALPMALDELLADAGLPPARLNLEITEVAAVVAMDRTAARVRELRRRGLHVTLDDFGTGFSSLTWLQQLPVTMLKLDQSFTTQLGKHSQTDAIVDSVVRLAHSLELEIIAEGVETAGQLTHLRRLEFDYAQGFHICRPVPAEHVLPYVRRPR